MKTNYNVLFFLILKQIFFCTRLTIYLDNYSHCKTLLSTMKIAFPI